MTRTTAAKTALSPRLVGLALFRSGPVLFIAFAFAIMADPVSSVAYTIEASLRALNGHLELLMATQLIVLGIITLVDINYWDLVARFPEGGGAAAASARAFTEALAFVPLAALIVDFVLTITISIASGVDAIIAYLPDLSPARIVLGLALLVAVAGWTWFGHGGRLTFAIMTLLFVASSVVILVHGFVHPVTASGHAPITGPQGAVLPTVLFTFPVAMALATGTEAPSTAMAQLGQLTPHGRVWFTRSTLALTLVIVVGLTIGLTALAVRLHVGIPATNSTQIADVARAAVGGGAAFALFQAATNLLLLAAASSSYQAGPGLLKALARGGGGIGILPQLLSRTNRYHTPYWGVMVFLAVSALLLVIAEGRTQALVLFYAVSVFMAFLSGLISMSRFFFRERRWGRLLVSVIGAVLVAFTLAIDVARGSPVVSMAVALAMALLFYLLWVRAGRPRGVGETLLKAEAD